MCGIFGHIGAGNSLKKSLLGLKFLEYRGYDSAGIAGIHEGKIVCYKEKGKLSQLEKKIGLDPPSLSITIGHTRWATHGVASAKNAHPHLDPSKTLALVHNGIIENHTQIRSMLKEKGFIFQTETDTEVIAVLISHLYHGDLVKAVQEATSYLKGFWALAILHKNHPGQIVVTRKENPLIIGISKKRGEAYISSDPCAFQETDMDLFFLGNHEIAVVTKDSVKIFDRDANSISQSPQKMDLPQLVFDKGDFPHFMLKEIFEQPSAIASTIHNRFLLEKGKADLENFDPKPGEFSKIIFLGCGTSYHAGCIAAMQCEAIAKIPAQAEIASEFRYKFSQLEPNTLVIALSQSGETFDTIAAIRKAKSEGAKVLAICNAFGSTLTLEADFTLYLRAGPEISVCSTKAFNCLLALLSLVALKFAHLQSIPQESFAREIPTLPKIAEKVLEQEETLLHLAQKYAPLSHFFFIGRQYMYPASSEASLKLQEISYLHSLACPAGELKHGPLALVDSHCLVIGLCGNALTYDKMLSNLMEVKARRGKVLAFAPEGAPEIGDIADDVLWLPSISDSLAPIPYSIAAQLFAYYIAKERGREIDQPRNLAKSVTVE